MNISRNAFYFSTLLLVCCAGVLPAFSQAGPKSTAEPTYEAILQVIVGSNEPAASARLPKNLSTLSTLLNENYSFSAYRLTNTIIGRVANSGGLEYRSLTDLFGKTTEAELPTFMDWNLAGLKSSTGDGEPQSLHVQQFRFGIKVPIKIMQPSGDGKSSVGTVYEPVGLTVNRVSLPENQPTMIGSISLPKSSGTVFLVLTVRSVTN